MVKELTVGDLRRAIDGVADDVPVILSSDTGVDQGDGPVIISDASYIEYNNIRYLSIQADYVAEQY